MKNPWLKKNPFMSMWLSGANTVANTARAHATVEAKRQTTALMKESVKQGTDFWMSAFMPKPAAAPAAKATPKAKTGTAAKAATKKRKAKRR